MHLHLSPSSTDWLKEGRHSNGWIILVGFIYSWLVSPAAGSPPLWPGSATPIQPHSNLFSLPCSILHPAQSNEVADRILPLALPGLFGDINLILFFLRWTFIYLLTFAPHKKSYKLYSCQMWTLPTPRVLPTKSTRFSGTNFSAFSLFNSCKFGNED